MREGIGGGCGCFLILLGIAVLISFPTILRLLDKLIDKL